MDDIKFLSVQQAQTILNYKNTKTNAAVYFIQPTRCNLYSVLYYYQCSTLSGGFSAHHQPKRRLQSPIRTTAFVFNTFCRKYSWSENFSQSCNAGRTSEHGNKKVYVTTCLHNHTLARDVLLFWVVGPRMLVVVSKRLETPIGPIYKGQAVQEEISHTLTASMKHKMIQTRRWWEVIKPEVASLTLHPSAHLRA